jgi:hypothetical protein
VGTVFDEILLLLYYNIMRISYIIIIILITTIFAFLEMERSAGEKFTVPIPDFKNMDSELGYCGPNTTFDEFKKGNYNTKCWKDMTLEMCNDMNKNGFYCGVNPATGKKLECVHSLGKCKDDSMCFSTCYEQRDYPSYMIEVDSNNLIGLF